MHFKPGKGSMFRAHQPEILQKKGGKNIPFLDVNIPYLEDGRGGVMRALTKKINLG